MFATPPALTPRLQFSPLSPPGFSRRRHPRFPLPPPIFASLRAAAGSPTRRRIAATPPACCLPAAVCRHYRRRRQPIFASFRFRRGFKRHGMSFTPAADAAMPAFTPRRRATLDAVSPPASPIASQPMPPPVALHACHFPAVFRRRHASVFAVTPGYAEIAAACRQMLSRRHADAARLPLAADGFRAANSSPDAEFLRRAGFRRSPAPPGFRLPVSRAASDFLPPPAPVMLRRLIFTAARRFATPQEIFRRTLAASPAA